MFSIFHASLGIVKEGSSWIEYFLGNSPVVNRGLIVFLVHLFSIYVDERERIIEMFCFIQRWEVLGGRCKSCFDTDIKCGSVLSSSRCGAPGSKT